MDWSGWTSIDTPPDYTGPAVYKLRITNAQEPIPIGRLLGVDTAGTLSIGSAGLMTDRQENFVTARAKCYGHSSVNLLYYLEKFSSVGKIHPAAIYEYSFADCTSKVEAGELETCLLKNYFIRFGELPPLNSSFPKRYDGQGWAAEAEYLLGFGPR